MSLGIRGFNPIWSEFDLTGNIFDDTYWMFVLEKTIPYLPANVYHDPELNVVWNNPIQFLANGTLPVDIFFETNTVYRLEFRKGDTQADPLIYEVNDYIPGTDNTPVDLGNSTSDNQVTNPQFSLISFQSPLSISATNPDPIEVAPGWFFEAEGTGTATITQVPLSSTNTNASNAPYALQLTLNGWDAGTVFLRQRFEQNGMLWADKTVSSTVTARLDGSIQSISAALIDSRGAPLTTVLASTPVNQSWNEFTGHGTLPDTSNTNTPPDAYIDYKLAIPSNVDIYVTSIQLVVQDALNISEPTFIQDSINRQIDHTFNYYKNPLLIKPIPSMLTGWDFSLNPAQFGANKTITTTADYVWDQTIACCSATTLAVVRNAVTGGIKATSSGANQAFYYQQYLSGNKVRAMILNKLAVNVSGFRNQTGGTATVRVYLYRAPTASVIPTLSDPLGTVDANGVFTLTAPVIADNWTLIPRGTFGQAIGNLSTVNTGNYAQLNNIEDLSFTGWQETLGTKIADTDKFAIVVTVQCPTTATIVTIDSISLVPGEVATRPAPQTIDQVLRECEYYFEKSYQQGYPFNAQDTNNQLVFPSATVDISGSPSPTSTTSNAYPDSFNIRFNTVKKSPSPVINVYSPTTPVSAGTFFAQIYGTSPVSGTSFNVLTFGDYWKVSWSGAKGISYGASNPTLLLTVVQALAGQSTSAYIAIHYDADARLGVV